MTDQNSGAAAIHGMPPEAQIMQLAMGSFATQAVYVAAKLSIASCCYFYFKCTVSSTKNDQGRRCTVQSRSYKTLCWNIYQIWLLMISQGSVSEIGLH